MFDGAAAPLHRIFHALQGDEGVDAADGAQAHRWACGLRFARLRQAEAPGELARRAVEDAVAAAVPFGPLTRRS
jgi:hypothetical protein